MSAYNPPTYYFNGIGFNSSFYTVTTGLTQSQANALYLKKTTPDTATAIETFNAGIKTNSILQRSNATLFIGDDINTISFLTPNLLMGDFGGTVSITPSILNLGDGIANINVGGTTSAGSGSIVIGGTCLGGNIQLGNALGTAPNISIIGTTLMNGQLTINSTGTNPTNIGNSGTSNTISGKVYLPNLNTGYTYANTALLSIANNATTTVPFSTFTNTATNGVAYDNVNNVWKNSTGNTITVIISYECNWAASSVNYRAVQISCSAYSRGMGSSGTYPSFNQAFYMNGTATLVVPVNATFGIQVFQSSGSNLGATVYSNFVSI